LPTLPVKVAPERDTQFPNPQLHTDGYERAKYRRALLRLTDFACFSPCPHRGGNAMYNDLLLDRIAAAPVPDVQAARIHELSDEIESLNNLLSPEAQQLIRDLRPRTVSEDVYEEIDERASFGDRLADKMATWVGSWRFITFFCVFMLAWMSINAFMLGKNAFDPFPFILLNLTLSTLAALQAPVILMAQNRQAAKDRAVAQNDMEQIRADNSRQQAAQAAG
jgi:uncharacterized membrane protein